MYSVLLKSNRVQAPVQNMSRSQSVSVELHTAPQPHLHFVPSKTLIRWMRLHTLQRWSFERPPRETASFVKRRQIDGPEPLE